MDATPMPRSEAFAEDLPGYTEEDPAETAAADAPLRVLPWFTLAVALVGSSALTMVAVPL
ncbi:MAG: hypothetical protein U5L05_14230 [Rubrivivax sp.]|nr:hypothetical protein [Rubrivivax sp.]